jgi:hypothetical protein
MQVKYYAKDEKIIYILTALLLLLLTTAWLWSTRNSETPENKRRNLQNGVFRQGIKI